MATAFGEALATGRRATVLCGDLAFLHDAGALLAEVRGRGRIRVELHGVAPIMRLFAEDEP